MLPASLHGGPRTLRRLACAVVCALLLAPAAGAQDVTVDSELEAAVASADPTQQLEVIVAFDGDGPLTAAQITRLEQLGVPGLRLRALPIAGVLATPAQIETIAGWSDVRSLWHNDRLEVENRDATALTGVDRLREDPSLRTPDGLPYSGRGIGVLVNDTGVDGTHPDLQYPEHVVQNVAGQTNLHAHAELLPYTPTEDVPNTDIGGGHGTHVAGIVGGTGAQSGGTHEGVAPGADLIGYGSGAVVAILDVLGAFDYALTHQHAYNIRVVSNSFGNPDEKGSDFNPDHPTNIATKQLADRGIVVVFSAGNSGPGEFTITGNFKKAPWVVTVAAGDDKGALADFSSRGLAHHGGTVTVDGETMRWSDRPTVTAPGVGIVSARASTNSIPSTSDTNVDPAYLPFYTTFDGTSMAAPHVSGIVALMLEANPRLQPTDVKRILQETATNMPGRETWEAGAGYVNAYAAVEAAFGIDDDGGSTVNAHRDFNSEVQLSARDRSFSVEFNPVGETEKQTFEVSEGASRVSAYASIPNNTMELILTDPNGQRHRSNITVPLALSFASVSAPAVPGTWTVTAQGFPFAPFGLTNGPALPDTVNGTFRTWHDDGITGLHDVEGHPAESDIQFAVRERLVDGFPNGTYRPDAPLTRRQLAEYLVMGTGIRQYTPTDGSSTVGDVAAEDEPFVEAVLARGAALKDGFHQYDGVMRADGAFRPNKRVTRVDLAYSLVQSLGLEAMATDHSGDVTVEYKGEPLTIEDQDAIPEALRGYVQVALGLNLLNAHFSLEQGPTDLEPTIHAYFHPDRTVTRGAYAVAATRHFAIYDQVTPEGVEESSSSTTSLATTSADGRNRDTNSQRLSFELRPNYPNPFTTSTQIAFSIAEPGPVQLTVYNLLGQRVRTLVDEGSMSPGRHTVRFDGSSLASGTYLYRLTANGQTKTSRMVLVK